MAVVNRTLDASEQRKSFVSNYGAYATGVTQLVMTVPFASTLDGLQLVVYGISGSPTYQLNVDRFIAGSGFTTIILATGSSNPGRAFGTSGVASAVLAASGSTLRNLLANDVLVLTSGGANSAATAVSAAVVLKPLQDVKTQFGV